MTLDTFNFPWGRPCTMTLLTTVEYQCNNGNLFLPFVIITIRSFPYSWHRWVCSKSNTTDATSGAGTTYKSTRVPRIFARFMFLNRYFYVVFCRSLVILLTIVLSVFLIYGFWLPFYVSSNFFLYQNDKRSNAWHIQCR